MSMDHLPDEDELGIAKVIDTETMSKKHPTIENDTVFDRFELKTTFGSVKYVADIKNCSDTRPTIVIDPEAERKLRLKIDLYVVPTVSLLYLFCFIDRANVGNARIAGMEKDLRLQGYDYNRVLSMFYISYILFELPATLACKAMTPGYFLPLSTVLFGVASLSTGFCHNFSQICGVRFLLGMFEAGMLPGTAYYLSRWYRPKELVFRLSLYIVTAPLAGAFGGLLASAILRLSSFGSLTSWRMLFAIEGIITIGLGLIAFLTLTDRPETARWLSSTEKELAEARISADRAGSSKVLDKMDIRKVLVGILNPNTMATSLIFLFDNITVNGLALFLPTIVSAIYPGRSVIYLQLRTVPPYVVGAFFTLLVPYISWRMNRRLIFFIFCSLLTIAGFSMAVATHNKLTRYAATFLVTAGAFAFGALTNAQVSANVVSDTARASAIGFNVMIGNIGGLIATWSYLPSDKPEYKIGNSLNLAVNVGIGILSIAMLVAMLRDNDRRAQRVGKPPFLGLSEKEVEDLDWRHPSFKWSI